MTSSALFRAAQRGDLNVVKNLVEDFETNAHIMRLALRVAIRNNWAAVARFLWELRPYVMSGSLCYVSRFGDANMVLTYFDLTTPENPHLLVSDLKRPLEDACSFGNKSTVQCLVRAKAQVHGTTRMSPLFFAIGNGPARVVLWLLQRKASLNALMGYNNETPLEMALRYAKGTRERQLFLSKALYLKGQQKVNRVCALLTRALRVQAGASKLRIK
jgi:ankyrin repeat protein